MPFIDTEKDNVLSFYGDKINLETKGKIQMIKANSIIRNCLINKT